MISIPDGSRTILEIAVDSLSDARSAIAHGADRLEMCSRLDLGGLTPAIELIRQLARETDIPLFAMVRPRAGDFIYTPEEFASMQRQVHELQKAGAHGVVFGVLTSDHLVDQDRTRTFIEWSSPLPVTFHRAFDRCHDLRNAAGTLANLGVARILTSGGRSSAEEGSATLRTLHTDFGARIGILPGGGVRPENIRRILETTGVSEVHSAARDANGKFDGKIVEEMVGRAKAG